MIIITIILIVIMIIFSSSETIQLIILHEILCSRGDLIIPRNNVTCDLHHAEFLSRTRALSTFSLHWLYILLWLSVFRWTNQKVNAAVCWDKLKSRGRAKWDMCGERLNWLMVQATQCVDSGHLHPLVNQCTWLTSTSLNLRRSLCCSAWSLMFLAYKLLLNPFR